MISTTENDRNLVEAAFYEKPFSFSYSSLNMLLTAPRAFYKEYVLGQKDDEFKKYLLEGTLLHYLVLENEGFDNKFIVAGDNLPSDNTIDVIKHIYNLCVEGGDMTLGLIDFKQEILDYLVKINLHQSLKDTKDGLGDDKRIAKIIDTTSEEYFEFLKKKENHVIIDSATLDAAAKRAEIVKANSEMRNLLGMDIVPDGRTFGVYNELPIEITAKDTGLPFGFKGTLDNMVIDVKNKLVRINDFKTTSKDLTGFKDSIDFWNYWLQAAMYRRLVTHFLKGIINDEWTIEFRFLVFDKYDQLYSFEVTPETMTEWMSQMEQVITEARYHYETHEYSLPYDFAMGNVKL